MVFRRLVEGGITQRTIDDIRPYKIGIFGACQPEILFRHPLTVHHFGAQQVETGVRRSPEVGSGQLCPYDAQHIRPVEAGEIDVFIGIGEVPGAQDLFIFEELGETRTLIHARKSAIQHGDGHIFAPVAHVMQEFQAYHAVLHGGLTERTRLISSLPEGG